MSPLHTLRLAADGTPRATLVALPGLIESVDALLPSLRHWASKGFDILGIDPPGHGQSPRWTESMLADHPGDVIVRQIVETIEQADIAPTLPLVLFGHSAGGGAAAAVATLLASRVSAVVLEDPFWRLPVTQLQDASVAAHASVELSRLKGLAQAERIEEIRAIYPEWSDDELVAWSEAKDGMDLALVANGNVIPALGWPTQLETLRRAKVPVLVVTGTVRIGMTANHRTILRSLGVDVVVVRGATHFIRRGGRDTFHDLVDDYLDRHVPRLPAANASEHETPHPIRREQKA